MWVIYEYWFARMKNISDSKKKKLREAYGSAKEIYYIEETQLRLQNFLTKKDIEQLKMARKQKDLEEKYYNMEALCKRKTAGRRPAFGSDYRSKKM